MIDQQKFEDEIFNAKIAAMKESVDMDILSDNKHKVNILN